MEPPGLVGSTDNAVVSCVTNSSPPTTVSTLFIYTKVDERFLIYYQLEIVLSAITIITNLITLVVIGCNAKLRVLSNVFFASLAVSDFVQGIFGLIFNGVRIRGLSTNQWDYVGDSGSEVMQFLWWFATNFSYCCLILITLERWVFIAHPLPYKKHWCGKVVVAGLLGASLLSFLGSYLAVNRDLVLVNVKFVFPIVHSLTSFLIFCAYGHIIVISYRQQKAISKTEVGARRNSGDQRYTIVFRNWRALRMSLTVFVMYFCTVSPWTYFQAFKILTGESSVKQEIDQALNTFTCVHFCSNFFVYTSQNRDFYEVLKRYCTAPCSRRSNAVMAVDYNGAAQTNLHI